MHVFPELFARSWTAIVLAAMGLAQLIRPMWFYDLDAFARRACGLSPQERERLQRVLDARAKVEGSSRNAWRWLGLSGIFFGAMEFVPGMPFAIPYALYCLANAGFALFRYAQIRRTNDRRAAPLVARRPLDAMSPGAIVAMVGCLVASLLYSVDPKFRIGGIAVAIAILVLMWIAWQIANSQAVMFGEDPQLEYAVDTRLRAMRVNLTAAMACAPAVVLIGMTSPWMTPGYGAHTTAAFALSYASFAFAGVWIGIAERRFGKNLLNHA